MQAFNIPSNCMELTVTQEEILDRISWLEYQIDRELEPFFYDETRVLNMENEIAYCQWLLTQANGESQCVTQTSVSSK